MATRSKKPTKSASTSGTTAAPAKAKGAPRYQKNLIPVQSGHVAVYASPRVSRALHEITEDMTLYHGVRLSQVLEAVYTQGKKDGARTAFEELDKKIREVHKAVPHKNPGKPKKTK